MKTLYVIINEQSKQDPIIFFKQAAKKLNITVKEIFSNKFDFTKPPKLKKGDGLYRVSTDKTSSVIEKLLLNKDIVSLHKNTFNGIKIKSNGIDNTIIHQKNKLPIIKTIFSLTNDKETLKKYAKQLGGFPLIVKVLGNQNGQGIIKVDSLESLHSITGFLEKQNYDILLRQFIKHKEQARIIVLGDQVIGESTNYISTDFRTNVGKKETRKHDTKQYDQTIKDIAIKAVNSLDLEFGGVDILIEEKTNKPYIAEVNSPCNFALTQRLSKKDLAKKIIEYLIKKSNEECK